MPLTAADQLILELINRARLDPLGEARRDGIDLNQGLAAGTLGAQVRQVLAPDAALATAADRHSQWMLDADTFSHTGANGSTPAERVQAAGYVLTGAWACGENIAAQGSTGPISLDAVAAQQHHDLFLSPLHRENILDDDYRQIGVGQVAGAFTDATGKTFNSAMLTEDFARASTAVFVTGVAYADRDATHFYSIGEGRADVVLSAGGASAITAAAGGYALALSATPAQTVTLTDGKAATVVQIDLNHGNVKLDLVDGNRIETSGNLTLVSGVANAALLGAGALNLTGNAAANMLSGNGAANVLHGGAGNDALTGGGGNDRLFGDAGNDLVNGGTGNDSLYGGDGADLVLGGAGADRLWGGAAGDRIDGGAGADVLTGGAGADRFVFRHLSGHDTVTDFISAQGDRLELDHTLWSGARTAAQVVADFAHVTAGNAVFDFGQGDVLMVQAQINLAALALHIDLI